MFKPVSSQTVWMSIQMTRALILLVATISTRPPDNELATQAEIAWRFLSDEIIPRFWKGLQIHRRIFGAHPKLYNEYKHKPPHVGAHLLAN